MLHGDDVACDIENEKFFVKFNEFITLRNSCLITKFPTLKRKTLLIIYEILNIRTGSFLRFSSHVRASAWQKLLLRIIVVCQQTTINHILISPLRASFVKIVWHLLWFSTTLTKHKTHLTHCQPIAFWCQHRMMLYVI